MTALPRLAVLLALLALAGCAPPRDTLLGQAAPAAAAGTAVPLERVLPERMRPAALNPQVLAISGGGPDGAFGAGWVAGSLREGTLGSPDIVTGVSIGAVIALLAILGEDAALEEVFTGPQVAALGVDQQLPALVFGGTASSGRALDALVAGLVTEERLAALAREHARGRRLFIGTTDHDAMRPVIWDVTAMAAAAGPAAGPAVADVLRASMSIPGIFRPVALAGGPGGTRLHGDGGLTAQFALPRMPGERPPSSETVIVNLRLLSDPPSDNLGGIDAGRRAAITLIRAATRDQVTLAALRAAQRGTGFRAIPLPPDLRALPLDERRPERLARSFERGVRLAGEIGPAGP